MSTSSKFITGRSEYVEAQHIAEQVFDFDHHLPDSIFRPEFGDHEFLDFDQMLSPSFWSLLSACGHLFKDKRIFVGLEDPHPEKYYHDNFGVYGVLCFDVQDRPEVYSAGLFAPPKPGSVDAFQFIASRLYWWGDTGQWGFWGERNLGIGIAGKLRRIGKPWPLDASVSFYKLEDALYNLVALNFRDHIVPAAFKASLIRSYSR